METVIPMDAQYCPPKARESAPSRRARLPDSTYLLSEDDSDGSIIGIAIRGVARSYRLEERRGYTEALDVGGCARGGGSGGSDAVDDAVVSSEG